MKRPHYSTLERLNQYYLSLGCYSIIVLLFSPLSSAQQNDQNINKYVSLLAPLNNTNIPNNYSAKTLWQPSKTYIININTAPKKIFDYDFKESSLDDKKIQVNLQFKF